ncbi:hypothetical protein HDU97_006187 [Phlyctochytrium planicorne]|nr:hypothetical protein HDU97_006187 [Phlyctochytrium planicorne]
MAATDEKTISISKKRLSTWSLKGSKADLSAPTDDPSMPRRYELMGFERCFTISKEGCVRIAHTLRVICPSDLVLPHVVPAFRMVFNRHPKMRGLIPDLAAPLTSIIRPADMTDEEVNGLVTIVKAEGSEEEKKERVRKIVEDVGNKHVDRSKDYPYFLFVHVGPSSEETKTGRLTFILFSDHGFSDGFSGLIVLNDLLVNLSLLIQKHHTTDVDTLADIDTRIQEQSKELPLRPSIYEQYRGISTAFQTRMDAALNFLAVGILKSEISKFKPVLPIRDDQKDIIGFPLPVNPSYVLFKTGTKENLEGALARCRAERVTMHGAICASILMAFAKASTPNLADLPKGKFRMKLDTDYNMRKRVKSPFPEATVGFNVMMSNMEPFDKKGVSFSQKFWDVARFAKRLTDSGVTGFLALAQIVFGHYKMNATSTRFDMTAKQAVFSDVNLSNLGKYPYPMTHDLGGDRGSLAVEGLHLYNSLPNVAYGAILFITSTNQMDYTMNNKFHDAAGEEVFDYVFRAIEAISTIDTNETMQQACDRILSSTLAPSAPPVTDPPSSSSAGAAPEPPVSVEAKSE